MLCQILEDIPMLKSIVSMALAAGVLCAPALAAHAPKTVPALSGSYLYSGAENCPSGDGSVHQISGTIAFDPATGTAKLNAYAVTGSAPELLGIKSSQAYSNTATTFTLDTVTYHIAYGAVQSGIAGTATFIGLIKDGTANCGYQGTLTLQ
jgi:hypothetical protein